MIQLLLLLLAVIGGDVDTPNTESISANENIIASKRISDTTHLVISTSDVIERRQVPWLDAENPMAPMSYQSIHADLIISGTPLRLWTTVVGHGSLRDIGENSVAVLDIIQKPSGGAVFLYSLNNNSISAVEVTLTGSRSVALRRWSPLAAYVQPDDAKIAGKLDHDPVSDRVSIAISYSLDNTDWQTRFIQQDTTWDFERQGSR